LFLLQVFPFPHNLVLTAMLSSTLPILISGLALIGRLHATPFPYTPHTTSSLSLEVTSHSQSCNDIYSCRTLWGIIYGCLATIFACTWTSFHPDVPDRTHTLSRIRVTRISSVLISFFVPELTIARAASQCWRARKYKYPFQGTY
jgi:hypothetical protein